MKTTPQKIGPLSVWVVGHPQNPLLHGATLHDKIECLAVFMRRKDAVAFKRANSGTFYRVYRATIIRDGQGPDYKVQRDHAEAELAECIGKLNAATNEIAGMRASDETNCETMAENEKLRAELADLQKKIHDGKIWNTENPRLTPRAQAAIALGFKEAQNVGQTYIGTEHLLLGLLRQQEGIAHRHFLACGMTYDKAEYALRVSRHS